MLTELGRTELGLTWWRPPRAVKLQPLPSARRAPSHGPRHLPRSGALLQGRQAGPAGDAVKGPAGGVRCDGLPPGRATRSAQEGALLLAAHGWLR
jgi:hypothetical protein